jgi:hypothetical protein
MGFSSPLDNFSGLMRVASIPVLAPNRMIQSNPKKVSKRSKKYHAKLYTTGNKKLIAKRAMILAST